MADQPKPVVKEQPGPGDVHADTAMGNQKKKKRKKTSAYKTLKWWGPQNPGVLFVGASPSREDSLRGEPLTGPAGKIFKDIYLSPAGLSKDDVGILNIFPDVALSPDGRVGEPGAEQIAKHIPPLQEAITEHTPGLIIALGRIAKEALGDAADLVLPHPAAILRFGDKGEVSRKLKTLSRRVIQKQRQARKENIDTPDSDNAESSHADKDAICSAIVNIAKADDENRLVTGPVLDPYQVDAHNDWISPADIAKTAHDWFIKSRAITLRHAGGTVSKAVESYTVDYPSAKDRKLAFAGLPHRAFRKQMGDQTVHSGAWIVTTKLSDEDHKEFKEGLLKAYSIEGFGVRRTISKAEMPQVQFVDVSEIKR